jgi:hypothetical protein
MSGEVTTTDPRNNPINFNKRDMSSSSKWKKYIKKIHNIITIDMPNMCLVKKTNNAYIYHSNDYKYSVIFECRFEGVPHMRKCTACVYNRGVNIFYKTCSTPKKLYNKLMDFVGFDKQSIPYRYKSFIKDTRKVKLFVLSDDYINLLTNGYVYSFVSKRPSDITTFVNFESIYNICDENDEYYNSDW